MTSLFRKNPAAGKKRKLEPPATADDVAVAGIADNIADDDDADDDDDDELCTRGTLGKGTLRMYPSSRVPTRSPSIHQIDELVPKTRAFQTSHCSLTQSPVGGVAGLYILVLRDEVCFLLNA
jgi:hypothetical protein